MNGRSAAFVERSAMQTRPSARFACSIFALMCALGLPFATTPLMAQAPRGSAAPLSTLEIAQQASAAAVSDAGGGQRADVSVPSKTGNIETLIELLKRSGLDYKSGLPYAQDSEESWVVSYKGKNLADVDVYISLYGQLVVVLSRIAKAPTLTAGRLLEILEKNLQLDLVKIAMNSDRDLTALTEAELRLLDGQGLQLIVKTVASAADDVAGLLSTPSFEAPLAPLVSHPPVERPPTWAR